MKNEISAMAQQRMDLAKHLFPFASDQAIEKAAMAFMKLGEEEILSLRAADLREADALPMDSEPEISEHIKAKADLCCGLARRWSPAADEQAIEDLANNGMDLPDDVLRAFVMIPSLDHNERIQAFEAAHPTFKVEALVAMFRETPEMRQRRIEQDGEPYMRAYEGEGEEEEEEEADCLPEEPRPLVRFEDLSPNVVKGFDTYRALLQADVFSQQGASEILGSERSFEAGGVLMGFLLSAGATFEEAQQGVEFVEQQELWEKWARKS